MTAVAVLNLVVGAMTVYGSFCSLLSQREFLSSTFAGSQVHQNAVASLDVGLLGLATGVIAMVAGFGVLKVALWGRVLSLIYATVAIIEPVISLVVFQTTGANFSIGRPSLIFVLWMIYPVALLIVFQNSRWKEAFNAAGPNEP